MFREAENSALFPIYLTISIDQNRVGKWLIEFRGDYDNFFGFRNFLFINLSSNNSVIKKKSAGITHWQHPHFHAYFPAGNSFPSILADMLSDAIGCICFSWVCKSW